MAVLRLTPANLTFVKRSLRAALPSVKSSHLTEGLAAALGANTHAALLARVSSQGEAAPIPLDGRRWRQRLSELGYPSIGDELLKSAVRDEWLPDPCWRVIERRDIPSIHDWFYQCRRDNIPDIYVSVARKYARLQWDCISTEGRGDAGVTGEGSRELGRVMFATFQRLAKHDTGKPMYEGSPFVGVIERLLPSTAYAIADELFLLLFPSTRPAEENHGSPGGRVGLTDEANHGL